MIFATPKNNLKMLSYSEPYPDGYLDINCTSRSPDRFVNLSPFIRRDVYCYDDIYSKNIENAWQYSKVYSKYNNNGKPSSIWFTEFRDKGFNLEVANRYPLGRDNREDYYFYWNGDILDRREARYLIYIPLYSKYVGETEEYKELKHLYEKNTRIAIRDFDTYDIGKRDIFKDIVDNINRPLGHGFVLYLMLNNLL